MRIFKSVSRNTNDVFEAGVHYCLCACAVLYSPTAAGQPAHSNSFKPAVWAPNHAMYY